MQFSIRRAPWRAFLTTAFAAVAVLTFTSLARAQEVVVFVDGQPITALDVQQRSKFMEMSSHQAPKRQEVIDNLVDEILELREAKRYGIEPAASDINDSFASVATNMGIDTQKLSQMLTNGGASVETFKQRLRAQMAWTSLVRGRFKASLEIADSDVEAQLQLHKSDETAQVGYEYIMRPILLVVPHGSPDSAFEARKRDADALRVRFVDCTTGISFARALQEVAVRDPVSKASADLPQQLRDLLDKTEVGHLTPPEQTTEGVQMFAVCSKKETKTETPGMKKMRDELFEKRFGAKAKRYLADLRRQAMIEYK
ncbi:MAG: SurA N-terminal domain-containing protein [Xanthobacteraceae bacterium]|jgi:peptidyl-prolyl cis-trans isomerase SurA